MVLRSYHQVVLFTVLPYRNGKPQKQDSTPQLAIVSRLRIRGPFHKDSYERYSATYA